MRTGFSQAGTGSVAIGSLNEDFHDVGLTGNVAVGILDVEIDVIAGFDLIALAILDAGIFVVHFPLGGYGFAFGIVLFFDLGGGDHELGIRGDLNV